MANMTQVEAQSLLDASNGVAAYTAPTAPIKIRLCTSTPTSTATGTAVTGGSYADQTVTYTAATATTPAGAQNGSQLNFVNMPACTVTAVEEIDSAGTPKRRWFGLLTASKTVNAGDTFSIASGAITKSLG